MKICRLLLLMVSSRANVAQLLLLADCDRFGCVFVVYITLAIMRFPVQRRAINLNRSIAITIKTIDLKNVFNYFKCFEIYFKIYLNDFRFFGLHLKSGPCGQPIVDARVTRMNLFWKISALRKLSLRMNLAIK